MRATDGSAPLACVASRCTSWVRRQQLERRVDFHEGVLGIPLVSEPDHLVIRRGCWFEDGDLKVHLGVDASASLTGVSSRTTTRRLSEAAVAWVLGVFAGAMGVLMAFVLVPAVGLFGDANAAHERVIGVVAAPTCGPALVAGPLVIGARSRNVSVLVPVGVVAVAISAGVLLAAW